MKRAAGSESTDESDSDAALPPGDALPGGHAVPRASELGGFLHLAGGGARADNHPRGHHRYKTGGHRSIQPLGHGLPLMDGHHIEADYMPGAHRDGVYGYGELDHTDPRNPEHRPFQSAPTLAAYRHQFGTDPTGISSTNHELNARQQANADARIAELVASSRDNAVRVDYGRGHRDGPAGPARPYYPGNWPRTSHMMRIGADGHYSTSIEDYTNDLHYHADTNDHVRDGRDDDHFPPVLDREEERTVVSEVNRIQRRRAYAQRRLEEKRKAMHEELAQKEASGYFQRHFR